MELWVDADDTLWENNVFFERAFARFVAYLNHSRLDSPAVRAVLDSIEHINNQVHGYGSANFARNLEQCFERLSERGATEADRAWIRRLGDELATHPLHLIDGVAETLAHLAARHHLLLFTKGDPAEQSAKIGRSGLAHHFHDIRIVKEKDVAAYRRLAAERRSDPAQTWMIGNSPKSDINPALAAGLGAVYVPHPHTWHLEHQSVPGGHARLLVLDCFSDLRRHF